MQFGGEPLLLRKAGSSTGLPILRPLLPKVSRAELTVVGDQREDAVRLGLPLDLLRVKTRRTK